MLQIEIIDRRGGTGPNADSDADPLFLYKLRRRRVVFERPRTKLR